MAIPVHRLVPLAQHGDRARIQQPAVEVRRDHRAASPRASPRPAGGRGCRRPAGDPRRRVKRRACRESRGPRSRCTAQPRRRRRRPRRPRPSPDCATTVRCRPTGSPPPAAGAGSPGARFGLGVADQPAGDVAIEFPQLVAIHGLIELRASHAPRPPRSNGTTIGSSAANATTARRKGRIIGPLAAIRPGAPLAVGEWRDRFHRRPRRRSQTAVPARPISNSAPGRTTARRSPVRPVASAARKRRSD